MIFKQIQEIVDGAKTQTRRIVKSNEAGCLLAVNDNYYVAVRSVLANGNVRQKWEVDYLSDKTYAVSPGWGKPGAWWNPRTQEWVLADLIGGKRQYYDGADMDVSGWQPLRIVITAIRREPLQSITEADAIAAGYPQQYRDYRMEGGDLYIDPVDWYRDLWNTINTRKGTRWDDSPDVWCLTFEVQK